MSTPLQKQLEILSVSQEKLVAVGIDQDRVRALFGGADPTIDEVRQIARALRIQPRLLITDLAQGHVANFKLRQNFRTGTVGRRQAEVADLVDRALSLTEFLPP